MSCENKESNKIIHEEPECQNCEDKKQNQVDNLSNQLSNLCLQNNKSVYEIVEIKNTITIPEWLKNYESPFSWHLEQERGLGPDVVILKMSEKLDELLIEEPHFSLQRFVSLLKLVLEYYIIGEINKSLENMTIIEGCLEEEIARGDPLYQKVKLSLGHLVSTTKAQMLYFIGDEEKSKKISRNIIPFKIMSNTDKAAMYAMKAKFFLYSGYESGEDVGVNHARKALELEPDNPEWEYLLAKMLRQQRREKPFSLEIPRDELKLLESAVEKEKKNTKYLVYLAQVYRECYSQSFKQYKDIPNFFESDLYTTLENMAVKALEIYKETLALNPDSPGVLRRVGYGIMNLPKKVADYDLALDCLLKSLEINENQMTLHVLGTFYHRYKNDNKKALEYFERTVKTGSQAGLSDMIRVKWIIDPQYDPCKDLEMGLSWRLKKSFSMHLLSQLGGYYLFIKRDFQKSLEYFKQIINEDKESPHLKKFKSFFLRMKEPIDLYPYLANESLLLLQKHDSNIEPETSDEEEEQPINIGYIEDFLDVISELYPELMEITPDPFMIPKLIQESNQVGSRHKTNQEFRRNPRPNDRGRGRGRGRGWGRGRGERDQSGNRGGWKLERGKEGGKEEDGHQRRGRFSIANQRERDQGSSDKRGGYKNRGGRSENNSNWRQESREDKDNKKHLENWRRKED